MVNALEICGVDWNIIVKKYCFRFVSLGKVTISRRMWNLGTWVTSLGSKIASFILGKRLCNIVDAYD